MRSVDLGSSVTEFVFRALTMNLSGGAVHVRIRDLTGSNSIERARILT